MTDEGLDVIAIERGPWRDAPTDFPTTYAQDELRYRIRHELFLRPAQTTFTFRNKMDQHGAADPHLGRIHAAERGRRRRASTGTRRPGASCRRDFVLKTHLTQRYGASFLPEDMTIQDWGVTYDDLEPHYDAFEYLCGTSGTAGNLKGQIQDGGNPFEGPRSRPYPNPPQAQPFSHTLFAKAARELGYKPFPQPSGNHVAGLHQSARRHGSGPAPIAASANGSAAAIIPRPARRPRSCRCCSASRTSATAPNAR